MSGKWRGMRVSNNNISKTVCVGSAAILLLVGSDGSTLARELVISGIADEPVVAEIFEIQGSALTSPFVGQRVTTRNNVVTTLAIHGFFMQTPTARSDGDIKTSDGIFVFTGVAPALAMGDAVNVTGRVDEFFGLTEFASGSTVTIVGTGMVPPVVDFDATTPSPDPATPSCTMNNFECFEGMRVKMSGVIAASNQVFNSDPFAEIHVKVGTERAFREPGIENPGLPSLPVWDGNPEVFELDADKLGLPFTYIPAASIFEAVGVIGFEFNHYEFWPSTLNINDKALLPVPVRERGAAEFTVGSLNLLRLFDDVDDPPSMNSVGATRDDAVVSTTEYRLRRAKLASYILEVLGAPDILAMQEVEKLEVLDDLAAGIAALDPAVVYTAHLIEGNDIGTIDVGFLTRDTVKVHHVKQFGKELLLSVDGSPLNDRPPLVLDATYVGSDALPFPITVIAVHQRSLSGINDPVGGTRVKTKRLEQAEVLADFIQSLQDADPALHLAVVGDFNAFEFTDGFADVMGVVTGELDPLGAELAPDPGVADPNLTNQVLSLPAEERYSFVFRNTFNPVRSRGDAQVLDHALTSQGLDPFVAGFSYGRGNVDAAEALLKDDGTLASLTLRSSDHDGLVLFIQAVPATFPIFQDGFE